MEIITFRDDPRKGGRWPRPGLLYKAYSGSGDAGFANVYISLVIFQPGKDFGPVPEKKYRIPLVSGAYAQKVLEITRFRDVPRKGRPVAAPRSMIQGLLRKWRCQMCKREYFLSFIGAGNGFWPRTREKVWNSFGFGIIGTKSIKNYKVSRRPPKGDAGGRAKL